MRAHLASLLWFAALPPTARSPARCQPPHLPLPAISAGFSSASCCAPPPSAVAGRQPDGSACPNAGLPKFNASQVRQAVFAELNPRGATVGGTFSQCSYGKSRLTMKNSLVVDTVELPCNGTT